MILSLVAAAIVSTVTVDPVCVWNDRGVHRVTVPVSTLVDNYVDIPKDTRDKLKRRIDRYQYDEMAVIDRDGIRSDLWQYSGMQFMHFGTGRKVCGEVKTDHWAPGDLERAMVYEQDGYVLIVPTVCSNLARVTRLDPVRRDRPIGVIEEIQPFAIVEPLPVTVADVFYPPLEIRDIQSEYTIDAPYRRWPEPSYFDLWGRPPLFGEVTTFARVPVVPGVPVAPVPGVDLPEGDIPGSVQPIPEPGTSALTLLGLALVGYWVRGRA